MTISVQEAFVANTLAISGLSDIADISLYPLQIPGGAALPAIQYIFTDGYPEAFYRGSFGLTTYQVQLSIYSNTYRQNQQITDLIVNHFNGFAGALNSSVTAQRVILDNVLTAVDTTNGTVYRSIIELTLTI